ncbi:ABC transporter permease subunit [Sutcliffiella sp. NC1]|uniref:ABC transporter permease subunit n=1 Tax=Sutcliffiella sp. NC1 TaxID=3004096 RepID=UPI0022DE3053|nr:ABC transporter permease subunit [Sutcliffiella sp. NC1]WBL13601.1 ABC transporter permease subunit [Sutcliffiella sp. NC1]
MKLLKFELKKLWKQKKFYWLLFIIFISSVGLFYTNYSVYEEKQKRAIEITDMYLEEINGIRHGLEELRRQDALSPIQEQQLEIIIEMNGSLLPWRYAINQENWERIPQLQSTFLQLLQEYVSHDGEFPLLQGIELESAIQKNEWLIEHQLSYEDEIFPVSPHLFVLENTSFLFGIIGLSVLLLLLGNIVTIEKEQHTIFTLKTQPVRKWEQTLSKFGSLLFVHIIFVSTALLLGILFPLLFTNYKLELAYPMPLISDNEVTIIPIYIFLIYRVIMFTFASWFVFSLILFISNWLKDSFTTLMSIAVILGIALVVTEYFPMLLSPFNPLYYFSSSRGELVQNSIVAYSISTGIVTCFLLFFSIIFQEKALGSQQGDGMKKPFRKGETISGNKLRNIFVFEWRKLVRRKLFIQMNVVLLLLLFAGYYLLAQQSIQKERTFIQNIEQSIEFFGNEENHIAPLNHYKEMAETQEEHREFYEGLIALEEMKIEYFQEYSMLMEDALDRYVNNNWDKFYEYLLHENRVRNQEEGIYEISQISHDYDFAGRFTVEVSIEEKLWLMENNVRPLFPGTLIPTIHHYFGKNQEGYEYFVEQNTKVDHSGLYSLYLLFQNHGQLAPIFLLLFLLGGGIATERGKKRTLSLLKTLPIAEKQIYIGKLLHSIVVSTLNLLGVFAVIVLMGAVFNRLGDWYYPILKYHSFSYTNSNKFTGSSVEGYGYEFLPLGEYLLHTITLTILVLLFLLTFTILLSTLFKNTLSVFATAGMIFISGYVLTNHFLTEKAHFSPFVYFNIPKITNGEVATILDNEKVNVISGSVVLFLTSSTFALIGYYLLWRKNKIDRLEVKERSTVNKSF